MDTVLASIWATTLLDRRDQRPQLLRDHPLLTYTLALFVGWSFLSILWATDSTQVGPTTFRIFEGAILMLVVYSSVRERRHLEWIAWAFLIGATLTALVGLGGATRAEEVGGVQTLRLAGGIGDPNELAAILVPSLALGVALIAVTRSPLKQLIAGVMLGIGAIALFATQSRGGLVALAVTIVVAPILAGPARARVGVSLLFVGALGLVYFTLLAPPAQLARVTTFSAGGGTGREDLWAVAVAMWSDHPMLGVGSGNFVVVEPAYATRNLDLRRADLVVDTPKGAHNSYLHELTELGLVGLGLFVAVLAATLTLGWRAVRIAGRFADPDADMLARGTIIALIGMLAAITFISAAHLEQLWLLLGLTAALGNIVRSARRPA